MYKHEKMEDNISKFELLLIKKLEGSLSSEERAELEEWLRDEENRNLFDQQKKLWETADDLQKMKSINKKKALKKVESQLFTRFAMSQWRWLERAAAILFIPLLITAGWLFYDSKSFENSQNQLIFNTVEIPSGTKSKLTLPDGTNVWLNASSSLSYPVAFTETTRNVELIGEAFFEVTKNKHRPFVVSAGEINIKVLGTSFNCSAYANSGTIETALLEGSIELSGKNGSDIYIMNPGELAVFSKTENTIQKTVTKLDKYVAWKSGKLMFREDPMARVIEKLGRWYGVEFQVDDNELLKYTYSATFSTESLDQVLKMLALSAPITFEFLQKADNDIQKIKLTKK